MDSTSHARALHACSLHAFSQYIADFSHRLEVVMQRFDTSVADLQTSAFPTLNALVLNHIADPLERAMQGVDCNFVAGHYQDIVFGACHGGVGGFRELGHSHVACGCLALALTALTYAIWRRALDNLSLWGQVTDPKLMLDVEGGNIGQLVSQAPPAVIQSTGGKVVRAVSQKVLRHSLRQITPSAACYAVGDVEKHEQEELTQL
jgi:hypothetical protein